MEIIIRSISDKDVEIILFVTDVIELSNKGEEDKPYMSLEYVAENKMILTINPYKFNEDKTRKILKG